jgi:hypothetical protein
MELEQQMLARLSPQQRLSVAVSSIEWTLETLEDPIENSDIRRYLSQGIDIARQSVESGAVSATLPDSMLEQYDDVDAVADEPGTSHFLSALMTCAEADSGLDQDQLFGVLSYCYEGSLDRQGLDEWSPEIERQNQRCLDVIAYQKGLIRRALNGG